SRTRAESFGECRCPRFSRLAKLLFWLRCSRSGKTEQGRRLIYFATYWRYSNPAITFWIAKAKQFFGSAAFAQFLKQSPNRLLSVGSFWTMLHKDVWKHTLAWSLPLLLKDSHVTRAAL